ncbi:DUF4328 domain-containing protein [Solirubrobacter sp. CPCC 204708]|uniref:DUF4328 domain-containing protein n=1 Tax=Solirubrobacter deserti TaxID=2282478 RepID=A0ABT4RRA7_9ACTN|nr:DUF4328 domain-containing protein [Solirubrobacter deserti]MBE2314715.1 DUF4328 domain-containing protein [Solirubrobacter deserti]MDA0141032.1 DUF4328 domain-containing protein [Solirubrobacter deserti]
MTEPPRPYEQAPPPPDGPPQYAPPPQPYGPPPAYYRPLEARLLAVKVVLWLTVAVTAFAVVSDLLEIALLNRMIAGEAVSDSDADNNDMRQALVGGLQLLLLIAAAVVFIMWLFRAYQNSDAVAPGVRRYGHGWAIGGWFVPIMNLWRPKQVVNDVWRAGGPPPEPNGVVQGWWALWLFSSIIGNFAGRSGFSSDTPEDIRSGTYAYLVSDLTAIPAAILAIVMAATLTRRLNERAAQGPPGSADAPPR